MLKFDHSKPVIISKPEDTQIGGNHYKKYKISPMEFLHINKIPVLEAGIIKYVIRHKDKNGKEDLLKARHIIDCLIQFDYPEE